MQIANSPDAADPDELNALRMGGDPRLADILNRLRSEGTKDLRPEELAYMLDGAGLGKTSTAPDAPRTIGTMIDKYLAHKANQAKTGQRSVGRYANLRSTLYKFRDFVGASRDPKVIDAGVFGDYYAKLLAMVEAEEIGSTTASDRMQSARQIIRWLWQQGACELPRNLESHEMTIQRQIGEIKPMPIKALQVRVKAATGRLKLELLLMANCGMYQGDCCALMHTQIDWQAGTITRKRSKNKKHVKAPTVTHYLWPSTLALLRTFASTDSPNALMNRNGISGVRETIGDDGKVSRTDNTASSYTRLQDRLAEKQKGFVRWELKSIRKASATAITSNPKFARYAEYFLGDTPQSVTDRHYARPDEDAFRECCKWLGEHLGLDQIEEDADATPTP
jgi:integrase